MIFGKKKGSDSPEILSEQESILTEHQPVKSGRLTRAELKELKAKRKQLRKALRERGIKSKLEFESFATEVGLALPANTAEGLGALFFLKLGTLAKVAAASTTLITALAVGTAAMVGLFGVAYVSETKGHFTINLTADMLQEGYVLSETEDFEQTATRLYTEELKNINAISVQDVDKDIATMGSGSHNGIGYTAYTFYIKNAGTKPSTYVYDLDISSATNGVLGATWVMLIVDGEQMIYSEVSDDGDRENLYGYSYAPFLDIAKEPDALYYEEDGKYGIVPLEFAEDDVVARGIKENMQPEEIHKYTVVVWVEGDDPQCTNDILGGHAGFTFQFEMVPDDKLDFFKGLYREEYSDAQAGVRSVVGG